jgi:hypothetical protein
MKTDEIYLHSLYNPNGIATIPCLATQSLTNPYAHDSNQLIPVYYSTRTTYATPQQEIQKQEQKSLLHKIALKPNPEIMNQLYKKVNDFIFDTCFDYERKSQLDDLRDTLRYNTPFDEQCSHNIGNTLADLIRYMNDAKTKNISEDIMGKYSYEQKSEILNSTNNSYISLFFSLLKKYNRIVAQKKENLPFEKNILYIVPAISSENIYDKAYSDHQQHKSIMQCTYARQYPAFLKLVNDLHFVLQEPKESSIKNIVSCFYGSQSPESKYSLPSSLSFDEFYKQGISILTAEKSYEEIHKLLYMIEHTRISTTTSYEESLADQVLNFTPSLSKTLTNSLFWTKNYLNENTKKHITNIFTLIKEYNTKKQYKITPSIKQYLAYVFKEKRSIPLPDQCNPHIFGCTDYALIEFCCLIHRIDQVKKSFNLTQPDDV